MKMSYLEARRDERTAKFVSSVAGFVRRIRPAPLAATIASTLALSRRRVVATEDGSFFVNPISDLGHGLMAGNYEPSMRSVLRKYLTPGSVFIDLGANEGYFSVVASKLVGPKGTVIAVEPQSRLHPIIQANLRLNECLNVRLAAVALSSQTGSADIYLTSEMNTGGSSLFKATKYACPTESVLSLTLEDFLTRAGVERCDLMKVDVEGSEFDIFMGAGNILRSGLVRNISMEIHNDILKRRGLSGGGLHEHMLTCGYRLNDELGNWVYTFTGF